MKEIGIEKNDAVFVVGNKHFPAAPGVDNRLHSPRSLRFSAASVLMTEPPLEFRGRPYLPSRLGRSPWRRGNYPVPGEKSKGQVGAGHGFNAATMVMI